jgi:DNA processing protein
MSDTEKYTAYFWASRLCRGRNDTFETLVNVFGSPEEAWRQGAKGGDSIEIPQEEKNAKLISERLSDRNLREAAVKAVERAEKAGIRMITFDDKDYPALLKTFPGKPLILFYEGEIARINSCAARLAVVGSRNSTAYGRDTTDRLISGISGFDICVVSGMARGIDYCAHRAALDNGLFTVAVLGCGTNIVYPPENVGVYKRIRQNGVIISEFPPDTQPFKSNFPARNRIIAGISEATMVVEAGLTSGALITADYSLDAGRDVLAVPHRIDVPGGTGVNSLIKCGAVCVTSPADILAVLGLEAENDAENGGGFVMDDALDENQKTVLTFISENGEAYEDDISDAKGLMPQDVKKALSALEIGGFVKRSSAGSYSVR